MWCPERRWCPRDRFCIFPLLLAPFFVFFLHPLPFPTVGFSQGLVPPPDGCTAKRSKNDSSRPQPTLHSDPSGSKAPGNAVKTIQIAPNRPQPTLHSDPSGSKPPENAVKTIQIHQIDLHRPYILSTNAASLRPTKV